MIRPIAFCAGIALALLAACDSKPPPIVRTSDDKGWLQRAAETCGEGYIVIAHDGFEVCVPYKLPPKKEHQ